MGQSLDPAGFDPFYVKFSGVWSTFINIDMQVCVYATWKKFYTNLKKQFEFFFTIIVFLPETNKTGPEGPHRFQSKAAGLCRR